MSNSTSFAIEKEINILNSSNAIINPSTSEGQENIVNAIENISIAPPVGGATEAKQDSLETLTYALYELIERLSFLASIRWTSWDIRTSITWWTVGVNTITTLTTLSNIGSVGWYLANPQIPWMMNNTAIISNINNISITP